MRAVMATQEETMRGPASHSYTAEDWSRDVSEAVVASCASGAPMRVDLDIN
jgi:hypothetical protein